MHSESIEKKSILRSIRLDIDQPESTKYYLNEHSLLDSDHITGSTYTETLYYEYEKSETT